MWTSSSLGVVPLAVSMSMEVALRNSSAPSAVAWVRETAWKVAPESTIHEGHLEHEALMKPTSRFPPDPGSLTHLGGPGTS